MCKEKHILDNKYGSARSIMIIVVAIWVQILDEAFCISHNTFCKGVSPIILPPVIDK